MIQINDITWVNKTEILMIAVRNGALGFFFKREGKFHPVEEKYTTDFCSAMDVPFSKIRGACDRDKKST